MTYIANFVCCRCRAGSM